MDTILPLFALSTSKTIKDVSVLSSNDFTIKKSKSINAILTIRDPGQPDKNISVKGRYFQVPSNDSQAKIPFARVNHNKYIVTDR